MIHYIYLIENEQSGKFYIGRTKNISRRRQQHFRQLEKGTHGNPHLQSAYNLYGKGALVFNVVDSADESEIEAKEREWFHMFDCDKSYLYNCHFQSSGGAGVEKRDITRTYIFNILDERYNEGISVKSLAKKHSTSSATILWYVNEWQEKTGLKMVQSVQVDKTLENVRRFVEDFKNNNKVRYKDYKLSTQSLHKYLPLFGMKFDDVNLNLKPKESEIKVRKAVEHFKRTGCTMSEAIALYKTSYNTFAKYLKETK